MKAKLFMIPWILNHFLNAQTVPSPTPSSPQVLAADLLVNAHHRHFYEMLRRQQQINDAIILNNALLHPHLQPLHIPQATLPQHTGLFNPFPTPGNAQIPAVGAFRTNTKPLTSNEKEGTVEAPHRVAQTTEKNMLSGVKTVMVDKKGEESEDDTEKIKMVSNQSQTTTQPSSTTIQSITSTLETEMKANSENSENEKLGVQDLEVIHLFKKLNLSKEETKTIVQHVEQVVREELAKKLKEAENSHTTRRIPEETITTLSTSTLTPSEVTQASKVTAEPKKPEEVVIRRNNLKHHPAKNSINRLTDVLEPLESEKPQGSIKTSLTHLPIIVTNEEDESMTPSLHQRILVAPHSKLGEDRSEDRDLLVDFVTGAPLDLDDKQDETKISKIPKIDPTTSPTSISSLNSEFQTTILPPRHHHHELSNFEKLASDYRQRLENTGDINKILQKISENAYISLVERGGSRRLFRP